MELLVVGWGEATPAQRICWLENPFGLEDLRDVMGWYLVFVVLLVVRLLRENRFRKCRVLALGVLA